MSTKDDIARWDRRFSTDVYVFGTSPNAFLAREAHRIRPAGRVLCVADGEGRNGVWLAERGHRVLSVDASQVALAKARKLAAQRLVELSAECVDLAVWDWGAERFDAVVAIFVQFAGPELRDRMFASMQQALVPGGLLLLEGYRPEQLIYRTGGPPTAENLYTEELLRAAFSDMNLLALDAYDADIREGAGHEGMSALIDVIAQKRL